MANLKPITDAIIAEAEQKAQKIADASRQRIAEMDKEADEERQSILQNAEKETEDAIARLYSAAESEKSQLIKNALLAAKAEAVKLSAQLAKQKILDMNDKDYSEFLAGLYKKTGALGGTVFLNERDKKRVDPGVFDGAEISETDADIDGGFIMDSGRVHYDCTLDSLFEDNYSRICDAVNKIYMEQ